MRETNRRWVMLPFIFFCFLMAAPAQNDYFFPAGDRFDDAITTPEEFLGYAVGDFHTRHDRVVAYFEELARLSDKAHFQIIGYTNERRPQIVLTITHPDNHARLEDLRREHLRLASPDEQPNSFEQMPVIVQLGYNVHGNEPSSTEAAMLTAYYLVASQGEETARFLREAIILVDPVYNPDGRDRHTNWANMHRGFPPVADPLDREHNEVWPGGRTNHYWFDLNRDWLPLAQVESRNRLEFYHRWLPNVVTDYHEMGSNATYFFEPTKPFGSENPLVTRRNYDDLNTLFADYYEQALNEIGSLYFTREVFDNSYPGYGSTYPDIHGGLGMVFEQASSRGHVQKTNTGLITFPFTIRNHTRTSIATVRAAVENRELLLRHQADFFREALEAGRQHPVRAYVFGDPDDMGRTRAFAELLLRHQIQTYELESDIKAGDRTYTKGKAFIVPTAQVQHLMVRTMFEPVKTFYDSVFYDASAWTVALAFGMPTDEISGRFSLGEQLRPEALHYSPPAVAKATYAYLFDWSDYYAPKALAHLLEKQVNVKTAFKPFTIAVGGRPVSFGYGAMMIPVADQPIDPEELWEIVKEASRTSKVTIHAVNTGRVASGIDLGSNNFQTLDAPRAVMLLGDGVSGYEAGEIWHLLDKRYGMPIAKVDLNDFGRLSLPDYNTLILVSGSYNQLDEKDVEKIKEWVQAGGTLILQRTAVSWAIRKKLINEKLLEEEKKDSIPQRKDFVTAREETGSRRIGGSVYAADLDITHPLGFGYRDRRISVYRNHTIFLLPSTNAFSTVVRYTDDPLLDGYIHPDNLEKIKKSASALVSRLGRGRAILLCDNPNFRGFWYGTNRLFLNALFLGSRIAVPQD